MYELSGTTLTPKSELQHLGPITDASYSPDNKSLVVCDANRKVILYALPEYKVIFQLDVSLISEKRGSCCNRPENETLICKTQNAGTKSEDLHILIVVFRLMEENSSYSSHNFI